MESILCGPDLFWVANDIADHLVSIKTTAIVDILGISCADEGRDMNYRDFCGLLRDQGFNFYVGVPCSILASIINYLSKSEGFQYVPASREDEAIGIAVGAYMGGRKPVVLMQNSGLGCSIGALTSLVALYKFPILFIVSWRGYQQKDAPEHLLMGKSMLDLLRAIDIPAKILSTDNVERQVSDCIQMMEQREVPVALILRRGVIE